MLAAKLGLGGLGCLVIAVILFLVNVAVVALVWNTAGLHHVFDAGTLSFWQCVVVALILGLFGI